MTEDLDQKFGESLKSLTLDVEGRLVQSLALKGSITCPRSHLLCSYVSYRRLQIVSKHMGSFLFRMARKLFLEWSMYVFYLPVS